jgi:hypothetical protein
LEFRFGISREDILLPQAFKDFLIERGYLSLFRFKQQPHILVTKFLMVSRTNPTLLGPTADLFLNKLGDLRVHKHSRAQIGNAFISTDLTHSAFLRIRHVCVPPHL